jgi:hypothetical protein
MRFELLQEIDHVQPEDVIRLEIDQGGGGVPGVFPLMELTDEVRRYLPELPEQGIVVHGLVRHERWSFPVTPTFFDPHVCQPPAAADLTGCEMDFERRCWRRWRVEHYFEGPARELPRAGNLAFGARAYTLP